MIIISVIVNNISDLRVEKKISFMMKPLFFFILTNQKCFQICQNELIFIYHNVFRPYVFENI